MSYGPRQLPIDTQKLLVSMLDGEPAPLSVSDALAFGMMGLIDRKSEQRLDGWYYTLSDAGRAAATDLQSSLSPQADQSRADSRGGK